MRLQRNPSDDPHIQTVILLAEMDVSKGPAARYDAAYLG